MAELTFNQAGNAYVAEFQAAEDFALHIERQGAGDFKVYQKTVAGEYAPISDIPIDIRYREVIDFDFTALVYPKFIKVVSENEPTFAEIISNGDVVELKYQEKSLQLKANGTTEVTPDAGFMGLSKVAITVDVPTSGEGGGGAPSGGGSEELVYYRFDSPYLDDSNMADVIVGMAMNSCSFTSFVDDDGRLMEFPGMYQVHIDDSENPAYNSVDALINRRYRYYIVAVSCVKNFKFTIILPDMPKTVLNITNGVIGLVEAISDFSGLGKDEKNACITRATSIFTPITKEEYEALITNA